MSFNVKSWYDCEECFLSVFFTVLLTRWLVLFFCFLAQINISCFVLCAGWSIGCGVFIVILASLFCIFCWFCFCFVTYPSCPLLLDTYNDDIHVLYSRSSTTYSYLTFCCKLTVYSFDWPTEPVLRVTCLCIQLLSHPSTHRHSWPPPPSRTAQLVFVYHVMMMLLLLCRW